MVAAIRANGWLQGAVFRGDAHQSLAPHAGFDLTPDDCCIVISQSCDILFGDFDAEPTVEIVVARKLDGDLDGNYTHAKNARKLHLNIGINENAVPHEFDIRRRFSIGRTLLSEHSSDPNRRLDEAALSALVHWIVSRYQRHAFPDTFNIRTSKAVDRKIRRILKQMPKLTAIYVALTAWDELPPEKPYVMHLLGTVRPSDYDDPNTRKDLEQKLGKIAACLDDCEGISVDNCEVRSEASISLDEIRVLARWHFDDISLRDPDAQEMPAQ